MLLSPGLGQLDLSGSNTTGSYRKDSPVVRLTNTAKRGQGVVEYAGALVVCAMLLAVAMNTVPYNTEEVFDQVTASLLATFVDP